MNDFEDLMNDELFIERQDGEVLGPMKGAISKGKAWMIAQTPLAIGDVIVRSLPFDQSERWVVQEPNYDAGMDGIPPMYNAEIIRESRNTSKYQANSKGQQPTQITYHVHGEQVRFNQNSTDNSVNVTVNNNSTVFEELKKALSASIEDKQKLDDLLATVDEMESSQHESQKLSEKLGQFISKGADVMTVIGPFIPLITGIATGGIS